MATKKRTAVPADLRAVAALAARCETANEFAARLAAGEAIRPGEPIRAPDLPFGGFVVGEGKLCKWPAWKVRTPSGESLILKDQAIHCHGLHDPAAHFDWLKSLGG